MAKNNPRITRKRLIAGGLAVLVLALIAWSLRPAPEPADLAAVERGPLAVTLDEEGETRVRDRYLVSAPVAGRVLRIELEPGDEVTAGETVLATFQPSDPVPLDARSRAEAEALAKAAQAALGRARADRQRSAAELSYAEAEVERYRRLAEEEIVSREALESAELELRTRQEARNAADFAVGSAEQNLEVARARLVERPSAGAPAAGAPASRDPIPIRSPVEGVVLRRLRESEAIVPAGEPLIEVADPRDLEIVSDFLSTDAVKIRPGHRVRIEQWGGEGPLAGVVRRVEPSGFTKISALGVEEQRVNVVIDFEDPREAWEALGDGYRVEVQVVVWERDDVVQVPTGALFRRGEGWAAFAVDNGAAAERAVEIGRRNGLAAEVLSGLAPGERVVVHPSDAIADGVALEER